MRTFAAAALAGAALLFGAGSSLAAEPRASDLVKAELLVEPDAIAPGKPFTVGVRLTTKEHWHTYWRNPGDSGLATTIAWRLPDGFKAGPIQWPTPNRIPVGPLVNYGYDGAVVLLTEITPPASVPPGGVAVAADVDFLVCERVCIPGDAKLSVRVPSGPSGGGTTDPAFEAARAALPLLSPWPARFERADGAVLLRLDAPGLNAGAIRGAYLFPFDETALEHAAEQQMAVTAAGLTLRLVPSSLATGATVPSGGVLVVEEAGDDGATRRSAFSIGDGTIPAAAAGATAAAQPAADLSASAILQAALFAFLGGLLLNLMPCVFPVLSIKVLSLAKHSGLSPALVRLNGFAYAAGVVASFLALAGLLLAIRAGGAEIGWGFQLQSPAVVAGVAFLLFAMGLSLSGVAEFGTSLTRLDGGGRREGLGGSFGTGVLATVVATPCTAPFMGAALGYAVAAPAGAALAVFAALGLGLAAPFVLLTSAPGLVRLLPRPGAWMATLKAILAFPIYATVAWLVFVVSQQVGPSELFAVLIGLVIVGLGVWAYGLSRTGTGWGRRAALATAFASLAGLAFVAYAVEAGSGAPAPGGRTAAREGGAEPYSQARLDALRADGKPVFVNLTAAWCITCLVNERTALSAEPVREALRSRGVTYLKGDWTNRNPEITRLLEQHGRSGVPLYLLYPERGEPVLLPQILTEATVLDTLSRVPDRRRAALTSSPTTEE